MGERGPVPKHPDERRRRNKDSEPQRVSGDHEDGAPAPPPLEDWHPLVLAFYEDLQASLQSQFYEPSDWGTIRIFLESLSRHLWSGKPINGQSLSAYNTAFSAALATEGDRRRLGIVRDQGPKEADKAREAAKVVAMEKYRKAANG